MDIKAKVEEIFEKVKGDEGFLKKFQEDPIKAVEELIGVDLPDEQLKGIVDGLKVKFNLDKDNDGKIDILENVTDKVGGLGGKVMDTVGGLGDKIGGIFKKD